MDFLPINSEFLDSTTLLQITNVKMLYFKIICSIYKRLQNVFLNLLPLRWALTLSYCICLSVGKDLKVEIQAIKSIVKVGESIRVTCSVVDNEVVTINWNYPGENVCKAHHLLYFLTL